MPDSLFSSFCETLKPCLENTNQLVVAYSGGLDSTVLLHLLSCLETSVAKLAIHVNHNISHNANAWQKHCQATCEVLNVPFRALQVTHERQGKGLEAELRELRYGALADAIVPGALLLTGQHRQDQVETLLLQLKRGAGPKGLSAMPQMMDFAGGRLLRPLLDCDRHTLESYAIKHQLRWVDDESNVDTAFDRNFLRHEILPALVGRWQGFEQAVSRSAALIGEQQQLVEEIAAADLAACEAPDKGLAIAGLQRMSEVRQKSLMRYWLGLQGAQMPSSVILDRVFDEVVQAKLDANPVVKWGQWQVRRFRGVLYVLGDNIERPGIPGQLVLDQSVVLAHGIGRLTLATSGSGTLRLPQSDEPVTVRFDYEGVQLKPSGDNHTRTLRWLFKQQGVPPWLRSRTPLIYYGEQLAAVSDWLVCEGFAGQAVCVDFQKGSQLVP